jgi:D-glycero-D-manno-heptose 1,7-bisphosphate phosphatase
LDRDGVINKDSPFYIKSLEEFNFISKSITAICKLCQAKFDIIIITNQSGIGRKLFELSTLTAIHQYLAQQITAEGGNIKDIFFCPHLPEENCSCRKPMPGMIFNAKKKHDIDLSTAIMVGDSAKDIECAQNAGISKNILVKTGDFQTALAALAQKGKQPDKVLPDLFSAAQWIIANAH